MVTRTRSAYRQVNVVEVRAWDRRVGAVDMDPTLGAYSFEYDPAFVSTGIELAPLNVPLADAGRPFVFPNLAEATFQRLPAMLADRYELLSEVGPDIEASEAAANRWSEFASDAGVAPEEAQRVQRELSAVGL